MDKTATQQAEHLSISIFDESWAQAWVDLGLAPPIKLFDKLTSAYSEPPRHYHTQQHLTECLNLFSQVRNLAEHPGELAIALWFHDAIYDVQSQLNERQSADWALRALQDAHADAGVQQRVECLILATKHDTRPADKDQQLLVDIDLSILGANPERFAEYNEQVRAEYSWVPSLVYNMKRKKVLHSFLARPSIYNTSHFKERYEKQARINLETVMKDSL